MQAFAPGHPREGLHEGLQAVWELEGSCGHGRRAATCFGHVCGLVHECARTCV